MTILDDRLAEHELWQVISVTRDLVDATEDLAVETEPLGGHDRLRRFLDFIESRVKSADAQILGETVLASIVASIESIRSELEQFESTENSGHLANAHTYADQTIQTASQIPVLASTRDAEEMQTAASGFRRSVGQLARQPWRDAHDLDQPWTDEVESRRRRERRLRLEERLPEGVSDFKKSGDILTAKVSVPPQEDGFFGRACPECERFFKLREDQWVALPNGAVTTCPYCGHESADPGDFTTPQQEERAMSALMSLAEQYAHQASRDVFRDLETPRLRPGQSGVEFRVSDSPLPPVRSVATYVEEKVRRAITCDNCHSEYAVYGATAFCPVCGPRAATSTVLEAVECARRALAIEDAFPDDLREQARADGIFDKAASDAVKESVTLFEVFARDQFSARVANHEQIVKQRGRGVFQRLDDIDAIFGQHCGTTISSLVASDVWLRLQTVFQQRHVLVHRQGIVDDEYVQRVPQARQQVGQRLVLDRADAEQVLDALEAVVRALAADG